MDEITCQAGVVFAQMGNKQILGNGR